jgi:hypothetical protein
MAKRAMGNTDMHHAIDDLMKNGKTRYRGEDIKNTNSEGRARKAVTKTEAHSVLRAHFGGRLPTGRPSSR